MQPKFIPILFQPELVNANIKGYKDRTRRTSGLDTVNGMNGKGPKPNRFKLLRMELKYHEPSKRKEWFAVFTFKEDKTERHAFSLKCPYGVAGDILYVRERFRVRYFGFEDGELGVQYADERFLMYGETTTQTKQGPDDEDAWMLRYWEDMVDTGYLETPADPEGQFTWSKDIQQPWKPGIHMPKELSRQFLRRNKLIRVERLSAITARDAKMEGIQRISNPGGKQLYSMYQNRKPLFTPNPVESFMQLIKKIHGEHGVKHDPWVWVVGYDLMKETDFQDFSSPTKKRK